MFVQMHDHYLALRKGNVPQEIYPLPRNNIFDSYFVGVGKTETDFARLKTRGGNQDAYRSK